MNDELTYSRYGVSPDDPHAPRLRRLNSRGNVVVQPTSEICSDNLETCGGSQIGPVAVHEAYFVN